MVTNTDRRLVKLLSPLQNSSNIEKHVVRGIILQDEAILVLRKDYPDQSFFELPGGKVDIVEGTGMTKRGMRWIESPQAALEREIKEEIGEHNVVHWFRADLGSIDYVSSEGLSARQTFFHVEMVHPVTNIILDGHHGYMWLPQGEVPTPPLKKKSAIGINAFWELRK